MPGITLFRNSENAVAIAAGETLFAEGDAGTEAYVIVEGEFEISHRGVVLATVGPGDIVGEMALIDPNPRSADCRAATAAKYVAVDQRRFTFLVQETPFFAIQVMRIMANRLRTTNEKATT